MRFVDSHLHMDARGASQAVTLAKANASLLITCGVDRETSSFGLGLGDAYPDVVKAFVGVHPSEVLTSGDLGWVGSALKSASGVGEVGLDPKYSPVRDGGAQAKAFHAQLEAAERAGKPVQVHSRGAERECIDTLKGFTLSGVLMHWFQARERMEEVISSGYFVSYGPSLIYSKRLQRMAAESDRDLVLTETDSPVPFDPLGSASGPSLIPSVVFKLSELWRIPFEEARAKVADNASRFLGASKKG